MDDQRGDLRDGQEAGRPGGGGGPAAPVPAHPSVLDSVVVHAEGALCRRRATVPLPPDGRLRLTGLPESLDGGSLRARLLDGPPGAAVAEARLEYLPDLREASELPAAQREVEELSERRDALGERHRLVLTSIDETTALRAVPPQRRRDEPLRRTPADAWLELAEFVDERLAALHRRAEELTVAIDLADHALAEAFDRLERASTAERAEAVDTETTVLVTLTGAAPDADAPQITLELEYGVAAARWVPAYRLAYRTGADTAELVLRACVAQRTGEDWTGVRLALSTADLLRRTELPRLNSLRIGRSQPAPPPSGWREPPAGLSDLFAGYDARPRPERRHPLAVGAGAPAPVARRAVGGTLAMDEAPRSASFGGYGAAPHAEAAEPYVTGPPAPSTPMPAAPIAPGAAPGFAPQAFYAAHAPHPAPQPPPPPGHDPGALLLDYPDLVLAGPEAPRAERGTLRPLPERLAHDRARRVTPAADGVRYLEPPRHAVAPRESAGSFDHRYDAAAPADIPSDGTWHTVTVDQVPLAAQPEYVTVPAVEEKVYATLMLANHTDRALLAGPVEVTVDEDFLLTAAFPTLAPGGTSRLGIGVTEGVEVARRTEMRESTTGKLMGNSTVLDHRVHVQLANRLGLAVTVEVRERVPVTSDAEVRIEERADWRAPAVPAPECPPGTRIWRVELPPGGRTELDGGYQIKIPAGKAVVGGNRRN
ncbi:DUF4139 domain-containing protein [Kitasatospora sp. NPDC101183]|uniref:DUF4139 domain-containing protein n=1 Tax=Kitasatospora sp. NPDC101183 TaxID=3364100 RepID=UPI003817DE3D